MMETQRLRDEELVTIIRDQDQELYTEVVRRYEAKLRRYALVFVRDEDKADDVVQNAFIKAFINLKGFNVKRKFSSWIYRILHNEAINYLKKHKREVSFEDSVEVKEMTAENNGPEEDWQKQEIRGMLERHLNSLPLKYQEPLVLFYLEERSYEEISDILHLPIGTVGTRITRGRKLLRHTINKEYGKSPTAN